MNKRDLFVIAVVLFAVSFFFTSFVLDASAAQILYDVPKQPATIGEWGKVAPDDVFAAQEFVVLTVAKDLTLETGITKFGAPTDDIFVEIQADVAGEPSGISLLISTNVDGSTLGTACNPVNPFFTTFDFPSGNQLDPGTYWMVYKRAGALSNVNYYFACIDSTPAFPTLNFAQFNGAIWQFAIFNVLGLLTAEIGVGAPIILDPAGDPVNVVSLPFHVEGTCETAATAEFFYDDNPGVSVGGETFLCIQPGGTFSMDNGSLRDGDLTLEVCNVGTLQCDTRDVNVTVPGNPNPQEQEFSIFSTEFFLNQLATIGNVLKSKVPIRYFFDVKELWEAENFTPGSPPTLVITLPMGSGIGGEYPILDLEDTRAFIGDATFDLMRDIARFGVWFGFLLYAYHRYRSVVDFV